MAPGQHWFRNTAEDGDEAEGTGQAEDAGAAMGNVVPFRVRSPSRSESSAAGYPVVWWDPFQLALDAGAPMGIRRQELLSKDAPGDVVEADLERYRAWRRRRAATVERAARPSLVLATATERARGGTAERTAAGAPVTDRRNAGSDAKRHTVAVVEIERTAGRPAGRRFGTLVHAVLAAVPLAAPDERPAPVEEIARLHGRVFGATDAEVAAATDAAGRVLSHPLLARARAAAERGDCRREAPVSMRTDDGVLIEGVVDVAFRENGVWTVVDYKTDRDLEEANGAIEVYRRQVALYAEMIARATGEPAHAVLMRV